MSPLMYACREGRVKVVSKLLDNNANINKQDSRGWTVSGGMFPIIPYFSSRTPKLHIHVSFRVAILTH